MADDVLTLKEGADYLKVSQQVLRKLARSGSIKAKRVGRQWRFMKSTLDSYLLSGETPERKKDGR